MNLDLLVLILGIFGILLMLVGVTLLIIACVLQGEDDVGVARRNERNEALGRKP